MKLVHYFKWCLGLVLITSLLGCEETINPTEKEYSWEKLEGVNTPTFSNQYYDGNLFLTDDSQSLIHEMLLWHNGLLFVCDLPIEGVSRFSLDNNAWYDMPYQKEMRSISIWTSYLSSVNTGEHTFSLQINNEDCEEKFRFYQIDYQDNVANWREISLPLDFPKPRGEELVSYVSNLSFDSQSNSILIYDPNIGNIRKYNISSRIWSTLQTNNTPPPRKYGVDIVYTQKNHSIILFGLEEDIWRLNLNNLIWERLENNYEYTDYDGNITSGTTSSVVPATQNPSVIRNCCPERFYDANAHRIFKYYSRRNEFRFYDIENQTWKNLRISNSISSGKFIGDFAFDKKNNIIYRFNDTGLYKMQL